VVSGVKSPARRGLRPPSCSRSLGVKVLGWRTGTTLPLFYAARGRARPCRAVESAAEIAASRPAPLGAEGEAASCRTAAGRGAARTSSRLIEPALARPDAAAYHGKAVTAVRARLAHRASEGATGGRTAPRRRQRPGWRARFARPRLETRPPRLPRSRSTTSPSRGAIEVDAAGGGPAGSRPISTGRPGHDRSESRGSRDRKALRQTRRFRWHKLMPSSCRRACRKGLATSLRRPAFVNGLGRTSARRRP